MILMKIREIGLLVFAVVVCLLAGAIGSVFTAPAIPTWYAGLEKPAFSPPNWLFAPVWTTLFILMGISLFLVLRKDLGDKKVKIGVSLFAVQLILNALWSFLFFGIKSPFYAFADIIILWIFILLTIYQFWKIDKRASYLLIPYIFWVSFASILNYYIWMLNV